MPPVHRLAAIFAADVASYSRLMGADEEGTHERLRGHFRDLMEPKIAEQVDGTVRAARFPYRTWSISSAILLVSLMLGPAAIVLAQPT